MNILKKYTLLFVLVTLLSSCFQLFDSGTNEVLKNIYCPSNKNRAILFLKGGNAATDVSLQVSIKNTDDELVQTEAGNIFTTDSNHGKAILDSNAIGLHWIDNNNLFITYNKNLRTFTQVKKMGNINIKYINR
jgi:hypothetical protein